MRPVLRGVSVALASCLALLSTDSQAQDPTACEYGVQHIEPMPVPEYGVEPILEPAPPKALMVSGVVTWGEGKPVKGVKVRLGENEAQTDADGRYAVFLPPECAAQACEVVFTHKKYAEARVVLEGTGPQQHEVSVTLEKR